MTCGIYWIRNTVNDKKYVGSSSNIEDRWAHHRSKLKTENHDNIHLQRAYKKYGVNSFEYIIIEECAIESLEEREDYYINLLKTTLEDSGYNKKWAFGRKKKATERSNKPMLDSIKEKLSKSLKGRKKTEEWKEKVRKPKTEDWKKKIGLGHIFKKLNVPSSSNYIGVYKNKVGRWISNIRINGGKEYLGIYDTEDEAAIVFDIAYCKYYKKEFGLNFPDQSHKEDF